MENCKGTVGLLTLGCKVNQYESEAIGELFEARGFRVQSASLPCDVYVINTCTVTAESDRKARQMIRRAIAKNPAAYVLVTGCLGQVSPDSLAAIEGVDYVCGNVNKTKLPEIAEALLLSGKKTAPTVEVRDITRACFEPMQIRKFDRTRAYIKIEDGCESHCTYCIIPSARGVIRSKPMNEVAAEVKTLTEGGCREVVLTGIETASYGKDLADGSLAELLSRVDSLPNIGRVRLGSLDPSLMKQAFVDKIAPLTSLAPHFHISMQSGSDKILRLMKRKYNTEMALAGIDRLRRALPDVMFTTDMIVGFPHETEEDFEKTLAFAKKARFLMIHVFPYSKRQGTPAAEMDGQVPEIIKKERVARLSALAAEIRRELLSEWIANTERTEVLFEEYENGYAYGHTANFIRVRVPAEQQLRSELLSVRPLKTDGDIVDAILL